MLLRKHFLFLFLLFSTLAITGWVYAPGLHGGFLFDDFANLPALGATGPIDQWPTFWRYLTSGTADPTGRPLTLLSFLLDARNWPADPAPFKRTSLLLHLLNGALLYKLLTTLGRLLCVGEGNSSFAAWFGAAMWMLHPLLVSTTLYIVQREAMLPATCAMVGLLLWLHGRNQLTLGRIKAGLGWSVLGLGGFTVLGVLAKANGALLPLYALLIEVIVLVPRQPALAGNARRAHRAVMLLLGLIPTVAVSAYLISAGVTGLLVGGPAESRQWSIGQRLMTEPRVLLDYLKLLWFPRPLSSGLFNDQYAASLSWLHPATTLPAALAVSMIITGAWLCRRRHPALALAVLFYFAGQLLESTSLALELYFEHRNYVPALLMFWPLGLWLSEIRTLRIPKYAILLVLPLTLACMTRTRAEVWGNVRMQALIWAKINPDSPRAQANAALIQMQNGQPADAVLRLQGLLATQPDQPQLALNLIGARCMSGGVGTSDLNSARAAMLGSANTGALFVHWFDSALPLAMSGDCPGLTAGDLLDLIDAGLRNPKLSTPGAQQDLTYLRGQIDLAQNQPDMALADFIRGLDIQVQPGFALNAAATLGSRGYPEWGLRLLNHYQKVQDRVAPPDFGMPMIHAWVLNRENYWPNELARLRNQLAIDAKTEHPNSSSSNFTRSTIF